MSVMNGEPHPKANSPHNFYGVKERKPGFFTVELEKVPVWGHRAGAILCACSPLFEKYWGNNIIWFLDAFLYKCRRMELAAFDKEDRTESRTRGENTCRFFFLPDAHSNISDNIFKKSLKQTNQNHF